MFLIYLVALYLILHIRTFLAPTQGILYYVSFSDFTSLIVGDLNSVVIYRYRQVDQERIEKVYSQTISMA